jgi:O-antigen ligase
VRPSTVQPQRTILSDAAVKPVGAFATLLFWLLVAAVAFPLRTDFVVGPFTTISALDIALIIATAYFFGRFLCLTPIYVGPNTLSISVLTPPFVALLSLMWATNTTLAAIGAVKYLYGALIYFVALQFGIGLPQRRFIQVILIILFSWLVGSAAMYLGIPGFHYFVSESRGLTDAETLDVLASIYTRLGHPYIGQSNDYGPLLALLGFILLGYARTLKNRLLLAISGLAFLACILTFSRGLIVGLLIGFGVYSIIARVSRKRLVVLGIALVIGAFLSGLIARELSIRLDREIELADMVASRLSYENVHFRLEGYQQTLEQISDRILLGYGAGYYDTNDPAGLVAVHNAFLEQWRYFGIVLGTITSACYIAIMLFFFHMRGRGHQASFLADAMASAWLCLLLASQVETFFEATTPRAVIYFILGLCAAVFEKNSAQSARSESGASRRPSNPKSAFART